MEPLLTIGLPVYNSMPYLKEAMDSILAQTCRDFKILAVVDDCTDGSVEYMESIKDPRLRVIRQPKSGLTRALNLMLDQADTPWLVRQDTDDVSYSGRVKRLLDYIALYPDAGMFYSLAEYFPKEQCVGQFRCTRGTPEELRKIVESGYLLSFCHPSVMLNVEKTLAIGGYTPGLHVEDADLWWRMALKYDIRFIPEPLIGYRQHSTSLTSSFLTQAHVEGLYIQYLLLSQLYGLKPQPLEGVIDLLTAFTSERDLRAKEKLRDLNILLAQKHYASAIYAAAQSFAISPKYVVRRFMDELLPAGGIKNGVNPKLYLQRKVEFWP